MSRITATFNELKQQGRKALISYITAGDPHPRHTVALMHALVESGADIIELGVPFSDPMADGPVIQRATERALVHRVGLRAVLDMVAKFRQRDNTTPVVLMGYANPVEAMGAQAFADRASAAGVDGGGEAELSSLEQLDRRALGARVPHVYPNEIAVGNELLQVDSRRIDEPDIPKSIADRLLVINFGRKLAEGLPQAVMADAEVRRVYMGMEPA